MTEAILKIGTLELRTTDPLTCRTLFRLINTSVSADALSTVVDVPPEADLVRLDNSLAVTPLARPAQTFNTRAAYGRPLSRPKGGGPKVSIKIMSKVWDHSQASGTPLLVLLCLADWANDDGECWPSISSIAKKCRLKDSRHVQRVIHDELDEKLGEVVVIAGAGRSSSKGGVRSNRYRITVHMPAETVVDRPPEPLLNRQVNHIAPADADAEELASLQMTIFDVCGVDPNKIAEGQRNGYAKAVRSIASVGATLRDVKTAASTWRSLYPSANLTVFALDKHWATLTAGSERNRNTVPAWTAAQNFGRHVALITADPEEARRQIEDELGNDNPGISEAMAAFTGRRRDQFGDARELQTAEPF